MAMESFSHSRVHIVPSAHIIVTQNILLQLNYTKTLSLHDTMKLFFKRATFRVRIHNYLGETISAVYPRLRNPLQYAAQLGFRSIRVPTTLQPRDRRCAQRVRELTAWRDRSSEHLRCTRSHHQNINVPHLKISSTHSQAS
jgi:hypothetical protein